MIALNAQIKGTAGHGTKATCKGITSYLHNFCHHHASGLGASFWYEDAGGNQRTDGSPTYTLSNSFGTPYRSPGAATAWSFRRGRWARRCLFAETKRSQLLLHEPGKKQKRERMKKKKKKNTELADTTNPSSPGPTSWIWENDRNPTWSRFEHTELSLGQRSIIFSPKTRTAKGSRRAPKRDWYQKTHDFVDSSKFRGNKSHIDQIRRDA